MLVSLRFISQFTIHSASNALEASNVSVCTSSHKAFKDPPLGTIENRVIPEATISFIKNSGRSD